MLSCTNCRFCKVKVFASLLHIVHMDEKTDTLEPGGGSLTEDLHSPPLFKRQCQEKE